MSLWVDKYRPTTLDKLDVHVELSKKLKKLVSNGDFPHVLIHGPSGAGKKTRIMCLLHELYGPGVEKLKIDQKTFTTPSQAKFELTTISSNYHIELNPSDAGFHDRVVIQEVLKEIAQTQQLDTASQRSFKVVVLTDVDRLSKDAQHALRRTMEKYSSTCRLILYCNSTSKVIPPIRSRCLQVRVPAPTEEEILSVLQHVSKKEGLSLPGEFAARVVQQSERNLRKALLMLEASKVQQYPFTGSQKVQSADWEVYVRETANKILEQQSPQRLLEVRGRIYELLTHCIPPEVIITRLTKELIANLDSALKVEVTQWAAYYEHKLQTGQKPIYHIEAFVAKFMCVLRTYMMDLYA
eukprot:Colp12_sorted_trinity150504_noHs@35322